MKNHFCYSFLLFWLLFCSLLFHRSNAEEETPQQQQQSAKSSNNNSSSSTPFTHVDHARAQIEWIRSNGGFFSDKLEVRRVDENDEESPFGVFARERLIKEEILMVIPRKCLLTSGDGSEDVCETTRNLIRQRFLKDRSHFAPYVNYLFDPKHRGDLPSSWSDAGKALLQKIVGRELPPKGVVDVRFQKDCGGTGSALGQIAYLTVVRRSWDDKLVPVFDLVNHRNGHWFNLDSTSAHDTERHVTVFAKRDVEQGEQLYLSYNECQSDCQGLKYSYVLQDILKDYGFVEDYPRRWRFPTDPQDEDSFSFVFQINKDPETDETFIEWLADEPNSKEELTFLRGHLYRLEKLKEYVYEEASKLTSKHERSVTLEFYEALVEALDHAVWSFDDGAGSPEQGGSHECVAGGLNENNSCDTEGSFAPDRVYDDLEAPITKLGFNTLIFDDYDHDHQSYEIVDYLESPYSIIEYQHSNKFNDTCLYLNEVLHTCTSFRPHYHEVFVHYPAQFVKEVKRVAFIGGGDGQILSEILKYPSLELVVGMELDHQIVRSSFENMKTQPHWDDDRVEWWYGDGAKSFFMLPKEYYGCFDLVLVDLLNEVVDRLKVAEHHSIMDAAMALVKPEGVVARNEDWYFGSNKPFAKYMIDLFYVEVPIIGHIGITVGSNYVDFFKQPPKDHKVHTLYLGPPDEKNKFAKWYNYKNNIEHTLGIDKQWSEEYTSDAGVLMIMEAERAGVAPNSLDLQSSVNEALKKAELNVIRVEMSPLTESDEFNTMIHILSEGYLVTRHYPQHTDYYGFELMLWDNFDKLNLTKRNLKAAVGSETFSCYRLVVDGIYTATTVKGMRQFGPSADVETGENDAGQVSDLQVSVEPSKMDEVLVESLTMASSKSKSVLVLCGQQTQACGTLDALQREKDLDLFPIFTCPDLSTYEQSSRNTISSQLAVSDCETATFAKLNEYATTVDKKVNVIAVDREVPHAMGKIFHAIFTAKKLRRKLLAKVHLLLATSAGKREGSWRSALLDRFRTDFALFDPAYRAEVTFRGSDGGMKLDLFSAGDVNFYERLKSTLATIEEKFDLFATLEDATNGVNNYGPDFEPSFFSTGNDYDQEPALKQRDTQEMIGKQMILQFVDRTTRRDGSLPVEQIRAAFTATLHEILSRSDKDSGLNVELFQQSEEIYVASAFWSSGSAILLWQHSADKTFATLNLFTRDESLDVGHLYVPFDNNFPSTLVADSYDEFPRGRGRIVSFPAKSII